jgi:DNA-binding transcriptional ArsR family regulator
MRSLRIAGPVRDVVAEHYILECMTAATRSWRLDLAVGDVVAARFGISPLYETGQALAAIRQQRRIPVLTRWLQWAHEQRLADALRTPLLDELAFHRGPSYPEFLTPSPASMWTSIDDELDAVASTSPNAVQESLHRIWPGGTEPDVARTLLDEPVDTLAAITGELRRAHDVLVRPHWARLRPLLEADIAHKARRIAAGGYSAVLGALHPSARWDGSTLYVNGSGGPPVRLSPGGLVLAPTVFGSAVLSAKHASSTQTVLRYPARGVGNAFAPPPRPSASSARLIGRSRAQVLTLLVSPSTPTALATMLKVTPSAVVQTLRVLKDADLVRADRVGRQTVYSLTDTGSALTFSSATPKPGS